MLMPVDELYSVEAPIDEEINPDWDIPMIDPTSLHFTFIFKAVHINMIRSSDAEFIQSRLIAVKEEMFPFDSLSSYETLKQYIQDMLLNLGIRICMRVSDPYKEKVAISASETFRDNQARNVRTLAFILSMYILEEDEDEDTIMREIIEVTMAMGPAMVPATEDSIEKLLNTRKIEKEEIDEACTICLEDFLVGLEIKVMPCAHFFHGDCIIKWLQQSHFCPLCRFSMPIDDD